MALTVIEINAAKPRERPYKLFDGGGLHLFIRPNGAKLWRLAYRHGGRQKVVSFGRYPEITLADARLRREKAKQEVRDGSDPGVAKRSQGVSFGDLARDYIARCEKNGLSPLTIRKKQWFLDRVLSREFVERPIQKARSSDIADLLLQIDDSGRHETARRARVFIGEVFRFGNLVGKVEGDPTAMLRRVLPTRRRKHHSAITDPAEFGALLNVIDDYSGWPAVKGALQISALCFARPGEIRFSRWPELDLSAAVWRIPAERMKMKMPHDVPLSRQAVEVFRRLQKAYGRCDYVFPSIRTFNVPLSENTLNATLRRLGYSKDEHTAHGFRTTASTLLNEAGFRHDVIETQLAHAEPNQVRGAYNRARYWEARVDMMQAWADMLDKYRKDALI